MMGQVVEKVDIEAVLRGIGVDVVETADPMQLESAVACVRRVAELEGVKAIIFRSPCAVLIKSKQPVQVDEKICIQCKKCIRTLGCPGIVLRDGKVQIESTLCTGCGVCSQVCPKGAIRGGDLYA